MEFLETKYRLDEFIQDLLLKRFKDEPQKQVLNIDEDEKLNFACPYCGDSEKKSSKKRGHIYLESNTYKCFNDGCMMYATLTNFVGHFCHKFNLNPPDIFFKEGGIKSKVRTRKKNFLIEFLSNNEITEGLLHIDFFKSKFNLDKIEDFDSDTATIKFLKDRNLDKVPGILECCYHNKYRTKIYIFNLDLISGKVLGFAERPVTKDFYGPKYRIKNYSEINRDIATIDLTTEQIKEVDHMNNFFNVLNLDFNDVITISEGQFDAMFTFNGLATTGISKSKDMIEFLDKNGKVRILFDNDVAGKTESLKLLMKGYTVFLWAKLIDDLKRSHNNNLKDIKRIKDINDLYNFLYRTKGELNLSKFNSMISEYFSNSMFDSLYI